MSSRSESLGQALGHVLHCQVVAFVVGWLALLAPITCQYHGLLPDWPRMVQEHTRHDHAASGSCHQSILTGASASADISACLHVPQNHQTTPNITLLMSLFNAMIPGSLVLPASAQGQFLPSPGASRLRQRTLPPPDQPPRFS
jgi:hypothetical protein